MSSQDRPPGENAPRRRPAVLYTIFPPDRPNASIEDLATEGFAEHTERRPKPYAIRAPGKRRPASQREWIACSEAAAMTGGLLSEDDLRAYFDDEKCYFAPPLGRKSEPRRGAKKGPRRFIKRRLWTKLVADVAAGNCRWPWDESLPSEQ